MLAVKRHTQKIKTCVRDADIILIDSDHENGSDHGEKYANNEPVPERRRKKEKTKKKMRSTILMRNEARLFECFWLLAQGARHDMA
mgnify:CR=1 FL=1